MTQIGRRPSQSHPVTWPWHRTGYGLAVGPCSPPACGLCRDVVVARMVRVTVIHRFDSYSSTPQLYRRRRSADVERRRSYRLSLGRGSSYLGNVSKLTSSHRNTGFG